MENMIYLELLRRGYAVDAGFELNRSVSSHALYGQAFNCVSLPLAVSCASLVVLSNRFSRGGRFMRAGRAGRLGKNRDNKRLIRNACRSAFAVPFYMFFLPNFSHSGKCIFPLPRTESTTLCITMKIPSMTPLAISCQYASFSPLNQMIF